MAEMKVLNDIKELNSKINVLKERSFEKIDTLFSGSFAGGEIILSKSIGDYNKMLFQATDNASTTHQLMIYSQVYPLVFNGGIYKIYINNGYIKFQFNSLTTIGITENTSGVSITNIKGVMQNV